jgi:chemotaxis response regulator CheB
MLTLMQDQRRASDSDEREPSPFFVAVGASGGAGLNDIKVLLATLPLGLSAVVLVVLHRPSDVSSYLREILSHASTLPVYLTEEHDEFHVGACYIGKPDGHLALAARSRVHLIEGANDRYRNRAVDLLFTSVAAHAKDRGIGVVLSGFLDDGSRGLAAIHDAGGITVVREADGSGNRGMPENAASYDGPIDFMGSVEEIAREIARRVERAVLLDGVWRPTP